MIHYYTIFQLQSMYVAYLHIAWSSLFSLHPEQEAGTLEIKLPWGD